MEHFNWDCACKNCLTMKAAPDLYIALKAIVEDKDHNHIGLRTSTAKSILKALAKAEGK